MFVLPQGANVQNAMLNAWGRDSAYERGGDARRLT